MAVPHFFQSEVLTSEELGARKAALRQRMIALRAAQDPALGAALADHVLRDLKLPGGARVAGVWPLPGEIDLRQLWHALHARGHAVLLPQTTPRGQALLFRLWHPGCPMMREAFGTERPDGPVAVPDVIFVPLLAFDRHGNRLGYGGGYYDRTLSALPHAEAIGFGYAAQCVAEVPAGPHDRRLTAVFTEAGRARLVTADAE
jgi:5-formyltetrahydrofolate cyclo-ligase